MICGVDLKGKAKTLLLNERQLCCGEFDSKETIGQEKSSVESFWDVLEFLLPAGVCLK